MDDYVINVVDRKFMIVNAAVGGLSIELLSKDCPNASAIYYAKLITALKLKPTREPLGPDGLVLYGKHYPMNNFSVKFYYKMSANQDYLAINI